MISFLGCERTTFSQFSSFSVGSALKLLPCNIEYILFLLCPHHYPLNLKSLVSASVTRVIEIRKLKKAKPNF